MLERVDAAKNFGERNIVRLNERHWAVASGSLRLQDATVESLKKGMMHESCPSIYSR
jgi:hypothetical protein